MRLLTRPAGRRLLGPTNRKVRAINQVHKNSDLGHGEWANMWDAGFDWNGWLKAGVDNIKGLGADAVKITGLSVKALTGGATAPLQPYLVDRLRQYLDYTRSVGLDVYYQAQWNSTFGSTTLHATAAIEQAKIIRDYPHVIGYDLLNEPDGAGAASAAVVGTYAAAVFGPIRALTTIPLTISLGSWPPPAPSNAYMSALAPYVDFWDFHCYQTASGTPQPVASQLASFRATSQFKPYLMGESGAPRAAYFTWPFGPTQQQTMWSRLGTFAAEADCLGVVGFCLTDYDGAQFGVYPESFVGAKAELATPFSTWPSVR